MTLKILLQGQCPKSSTTPFVDQKLPNNDWDQGRMPNSNPNSAASHNVESTTSASNLRPLISKWNTSFTLEASPPPRIPIDSKDNHNNPNPQS